MRVLGSVPCRMIIKCRVGLRAAVRSQENRAAVRVSKHLVGKQRRVGNLLLIADVCVPGTGLGTLCLAVLLPVRLAAV